MAAVLIAGMVCLGLAGDYVYFGEMRQTLSVNQGLFVPPLPGLSVAWPVGASLG